MAHTNSTENYGLPQWIGTDKPTFLGDFNTAFGVIDGALKDNADNSTAALNTANSASAVATSANTNANTALSTANQAATDAANAQTTASGAVVTANSAKTNADNALRASAANTIENLAPAYDNTLTYEVGDLVTFVDAQNSGKLYKCIVPVNTPMDFNINYWDDVTTSEAFALKYRILAQDTSDGVKNLGDIVEALLSNFSLSSIKEGRQYAIVIASNTGVRSFRFLRATSDEICFTTDEENYFWDFNQNYYAGRVGKILLLKYNDPHLGTTVYKYFDYYTTVGHLPVTEPVDLYMSFVDNSTYIADVGDKWMLIEF